MKSAIAYSRSVFIFCFLTFAPIFCNVIVAADSGLFLDGPATYSKLTGERMLMTINIQNTGNTTWTAAGGYKLISLQGHTWGATEAVLEPTESIVPSQIKTFYLEITMPYYPGTYPFQWQMQQNGVTFSSAIQNITFNVSQNTNVPVSGVFEWNLIVNQNLTTRQALDITVVFTGTSGDALGESKTVRTFPVATLGGGTQTQVRFRFSPNKSGSWSWQAYSAFSFQGLSSGTIEVDGFMPLVPACDIGESSANPYNFACKEDGIDVSDFFLMGDTSWSFSTNDVICDTGTQGDSCDTNPPSPFVTYVNTRASQGFNYIQGNIFTQRCTNSDAQLTQVNEGGEPFTYNGNDYNDERLAYFGNVAKRIQYANQEGIVVGLSLGWGNVISCTLPCSGAHKFLNATKLTEYIDYVISQFSAFQIVWIVSSNVNTTEETACSGLDRSDIADQIRNGDSSHMISMHPTDNRTSLDIEYDYPAGTSHNITYQQIRPCDDPDQVKDSRDDEANPVINGEFEYEITEACAKCKPSDPGPCDLKNGCASDADCPDVAVACACDPACGGTHHSRVNEVLHAAWQIATRGGYFVFGNAGTYHYYTDKSYQGTNCLNYFLDTNNAPGALYMQILYNFFNDPNFPVKWYDPNFEPIEEDSTLTKRVMGIPGDQYVLYSEDSSGTFNLVNDSNKYDWRRYSTITGELTGSGGPDFIANIQAVEDSVVLANKSAGINCVPTHVAARPGAAPGPESSSTCTIENPFSGSMTMSCSGLPDNTSCQFSPDSIPPGQNQTILTLTASSTAVPGAYPPFTVSGDASDSDPSTTIGVSVEGTKCDDFPSLPTGWQFKPADQWSVPSPGGDLQGSVTNKKITAVFPDPDTGDATKKCTFCTIEASIAFWQGSGKISLIGWFEDSGKSRVELMLKWPDKIKLFRKTREGRIVSNKDTLPGGFQYQPQTYYRTELSFGDFDLDGMNEFRGRIYSQGLPNGGVFTITVPEYDPEDTTPPPLPHGSAGFRVREAGTTGRFANFTTCYECSPTSMSVNDPIVMEPTDASFIFTMNFPSCFDRSFSYDTELEHGTATPGLDYTSQNGTKTIAGCTSPPCPGSAQVDIDILQDSIAESDEVFYVTAVSSDTIFFHSTFHGTGTIQDDGDAAPPLPVLTPSNSTRKENGVNLIVPVTLSAISAVPVTVNYATRNNTALGCAGLSCDYSPTSGTLTIAAGTKTGIISIPLINNGTSESIETFYVDFSSPTNATLSTTIITATIVDDDSTPVPPIITINDVSINEGASGSSNVTFTLNLSSGTGYTINYATANGTATAGSDYTAKSGSVTFSTQTATVSVSVNGDGVFEGTEIFYLNLTTSGSAVIADSQGIAQITDDDNRQITISDVQKTEGNSGSSNATFTISLSQTNTVATTVQYATQNGTATAASDYTTKTGTLTIPANTISGTVSVSVLGDTSAENDETFFLNLSNPTNAVIADSQGQGSILDDETRSLTISDLTMFEGTGGTKQAVLTVNISSTSVNNVSVNYSTVNGTAISGSDYTTTSGTLVIVPGITFGKITIPITADWLLENDETFYVNLSGAQNATITDGQALVTIQDEDQTEDEDLGD